MGQAGGQVRRPQELLMGRAGKVCCAEGAGGWRAERVSRGKAARQELGGKLGRQSARADGRQNLTAAGP